MNGFTMLTSALMLSLTVTVWSFIFKQTLIYLSVLIVCVCRRESTCQCLWITPRARPSASSRTLCSLESCWESESHDRCHQQTDTLLLCEVHLIIIIAVFILLPEWERCCFVDLHLLQLHQHPPMERPQSDSNTPGNLQTNKALSHFSENFAEVRHFLH